MTTWRMLRPPTAAAAAALERRSRGGGAGGDGRQGSGSSLKSRPRSSGIRSHTPASPQPPRLTRSSQHSSPTPLNLPALAPAHSHCNSQQRYTLSRLRSPSAAGSATAASSATAGRSPRQPNRPYWTRTCCTCCTSTPARSLSPFNDQAPSGPASCAHLQQPDPNWRPWPADCRCVTSSTSAVAGARSRTMCGSACAATFPSIAKYTYSEFRRLCATDRTVMAGFHAVTLFPRTAEEETIDSRAKRRRAVAVSARLWTRVSKYE